MKRTEYWERLAGSIQGKKMKHHACFLFLDAPFCCSITGVSMSDYYASASTMMECQLKAYDMIGGYGFLYADFGVVAEGTAYGGVLRRDPVGVLSLKPAGIETLEDVRVMKPADLQGDNLMAESLRIMEYMAAHKPDDYALETTRVIAPFTTGAMLRGISDFCADLYEDPVMVTEMMDLLCEDLIRYVKAQEQILGHEAPYILLADDLSSFLSREMFDTYIRPVYDKFYSAFPNAQRWLHNDADAAHIAASIADAGFQVWHAGYCIDVHQAMKDCNDRVSIVGNLPPVRMLQEGTPDSVYQTVCDFVRSCNGNTKYVISVGGYVPWDTPLENIRAMIQAVDDCGTEEEDTGSV